MSYRESCERGGVWQCRACDLDGKSYSHGSKVLKETLIVQCVDGRWRSRG
jgi:hypothetical protein